MARRGLLFLGLAGCASEPAASTDTDVLAAAVNEVWRTTFDADSLRAQLETGLP